MVMLNEVTSMGGLVMALAAFLSFLVLMRTYNRKNIATVRYLAMFFAYFGLFQVVLGLPYLISGLGDIQLRAFTLFAHMFLYLGLAYFSRIAFYIYKSEWEYYAFAVNLLFGGGAMYVMLSTWTRAPALIGIPTIVNLVLLGAVPFAYMAIKRTGVDQIKMISIALGLVMVAIAGPLHNIASTPEMTAGVDAVTVVGTLIILAGVYVKRLAEFESAA